VVADVMQKKERKAASTVTVTVMWPDGRVSYL
jgi:hypothetical protein